MLFLQKSKRRHESNLLGKRHRIWEKAGDEFTEIQEHQFYASGMREKFYHECGKYFIDPIYIEAAVNYQAELVFDTIKRDILLPLADHIAFAAKESREDISIKSLCSRILKFCLKEYAVTLKSREIIEK